MPKWRSSDFSVKEGCHLGQMGLQGGGEVRLGRRYSYLILVLCLLFNTAHRAHGALPSRIMEFRDSREQIAVGLGLAQGVITISSPNGVYVQDDQGEFVVKMAKSLQIAIGVIPHTAMEQRTVWRVQILATRDGAAAMQLRHQIETDYGVPTTVVHDEPWFKVQVGDAPTPQAAEAIKQKLLDWGYEGAWITQGEVSVPGKPLQPQGGDEVGTSLVKGFIIQDSTGKIIASYQRQELVVAPAGQSPLALGMTGITGRTYRGRLRLVDSGQSKIQVINVVGIEDYLYGVVGAELSSKAPEERDALLAQAVAARTYAVQSLGKHALEGFDVCATVHCQAYQGVGRESDMAKSAVDMTRGQILVYGGQPISAVYHASSGGATAAAEQVWATRYSGYLRPVIDEVKDPKTNTIVKLGQDRPGYDWEVNWDGAMLDRILRRYLDSELGIKVPPSATLQDIQVTRRDSLERVEELLIAYTDKPASPGKEALEYHVGKDKIRWVLRKPDHQILPSTRFALQVEKNADKLTRTKVTGQGNGHGVGLSQTGALHMARLGYGYREILSHYYTDVMIVELSQYYKDVEPRLLWEQKGFVQSWVAVLGPSQGITEPTKVFRLSPSGEQVAYSMTGEGGGLWVFDAVYGKQTLLLEEPVLEIAWKHDGSALAAVTDGHGGRRQLWVVSFGTEGSDGNVALRKSLLAEAIDIHGINWLPGSDLVLFGQNGMIYGGQGGMNIPLFAEAKVPSIAPNGKQIALWREGAIWLYQLDTGKFGRLYNVNGIKSLHWSPNGKYLAVAVEREVIVLDAGTGAPVARFAGEGPSWSSDGNLLAYVQKSEGGLSDIYVAEVPSQDIQLLASSREKECAIHWAAKGRTIAHNANGELHLVTWR